MNMTSDIAATAIPATSPAAQAHPVHRRPAIELQDASVVFGSGPQAVVALSPTTLKMERGDFLALVGPSGCGKSTILRLASNLIQPSAGHVLLGGREMAARELRIGMAFQNPTMLPWLTIEKNVMLPLKIVEPFKRTFQRDRKGAYRDRVHALLAQVGLKDFAGHFPWQLSGGMLQRANLCRALIHDPDLLLLDEPFGALDALTRERMAGELIRIWEALPVTVIMVTHSISEAVLLADEVLVMNGRPATITDRIAIDLPRPRSWDQQSTPEFQACAAAVRAAIREHEAGR